jgi:hypothetical protein
MYSKVMKKVVRDDPKLLDDGGEVPKSNGVVVGSIPGCDRLVYVV